MLDGMVFISVSYLHGRRLQLILVYEKHCPEQSEESCLEKFQCEILLSFLPQDDDLCRHSEQSEESHAITKRMRYTPMDRLY